MKRVDHYITKKQWLGLKKLAKETGLKLSELIRQAINRAYFSEEKNKVN